MINESAINTQSSLLGKYQEELNKGSLLADHAQERAVQVLNELALLLAKQESEKQNRSSLNHALNVLSEKFGFGERDSKPGIKGLYFWGGVGRGKTLMMDMFFESLPFERKLRLHFHRFMQRVHNELTRQQGEVDPLVVIAKNLAEDNCVICLDEFFVKDITDAMILAGLLDALFKRGVVLVTTSNIEPSELYKDGLQRARFLPAIRLLETHLDILNVDGGTDYRLRALEQAELFHSPLDDEAVTSLQQSFESLAPEQHKVGEFVEVLGRSLKTIRLADDVVWFDFVELCHGPRSQNDYIELAKVYHAVLISNVPVMGERTDDQARRFINLIDEFYDRNVKIIVSAEAPIHELYSGGLLGFEFERTKSRLLEMQSYDYLAREHKP